MNKIVTSLNDYLEQVVLGGVYTAQLTMKERNQWWKFIAGHPIWLKWLQSKTRLENAINDPDASYEILDKYTKMSLDCQIELFDIAEKWVKSKMGG